MIVTLLMALLITPAQLSEAGPLIGDLTARSVRLWIHSDQPEQVRVTIVNDDGETVDQKVTSTLPENGNSSTLLIIDLKPGTRYEYTIDGQHDPAWWFQTLPEPDSSCRIAFGSCAKETEGSSKVWRRMDADDITALVLLGDTPYIDTTDLKRQRERYRAFSSVPAFKTLVAHTPLYSTWDDHDFGRNDTDGNLPGKENSRRAFREHRPNPSFGENDLGIYTSFRQGPVEVFLLDPRWFARTEGDEDSPALLGEQQWAWLTRSLSASTAPWKVIAGGMVFNASVRPGKTDCWGRYPKEYERLLGVIKQAGGDEVVLVSGDVHWSRALGHDTKEQLGYDLIEFVTSPVHEHLIKAADAPHPGLLFSRGEINSFLMIEAGELDGKQVMTMSLRNASGETLYSKSFVSSSN